jgi:hypothetical protein
MIEEVRKACHNHTLVTVRTPQERRALRAAQEAGEELTLFTIGTTTICLPAEYSLGLYCNGVLIQWPAEVHLISLSDLVKIESEATPAIEREPPPTSEGAL